MPIKRITPIAALGLLYAVVFFCLGLFLFYDLNRDIWQYIIESRLIKLSAMVITAAAVAGATLIFQSITDNKILTPSIVGFDAMYILIQTVIVFFFGTYGLELSKLSIFIISVLLMIGGTQLLFFICFVKHRYNLNLLILVGIVFGILMRTTALFLMRILEPNEQQMLENRIYASFNLVNNNMLLVAAAVTAFCLLLLWRQANLLDLCLLQKDTAVALGLNYQKFIFSILIYCSVLVAVATSLVGPITFLGLLVVNITYVLLNTYRHKFMLPFTIGIAIIVLVMSQFILEHIFNLQNVIGAIIDLIGSLVLIMILFRNKRVVL